MNTYNNFYGFLLTNVNTYLPDYLAMSYVCINGELTLNCWIFAISIKSTECMILRIYNKSPRELRYYNENVVYVDPSFITYVKTYDYATYRNYNYTNVNYLGINLKKFDSISYISQCIHKALTVYPDTYYGTLKHKMLSIYTKLSSHMDTDAL
jgi:hypothetical protein